MTRDITLYIDFKSPYSYLAKDPAFAMEQQFDVRVVWRPFVLDIPFAYGALETRDPRQWRKVRYLYQDVRRYANERGLIIYGPRKIFESTLAAIGMLHAQRRGAFRAYADRVFARFFKRELDIEDRAAMGALVEEIGLDGADFLDYADNEGREELDRIVAAAERRGVFGVPTFVLDDELFWGHDRIETLARRLPPRR